MKNYLILLLCSGFIFSCSARPQVETELTGSLLWKISGNGLDKPSYVFGTHHLVSKAILDKTPGWQKAFEQSEQVVGELLMDDQAALQSQVQQAGLMPQDTSYSDLLQADELAMLDKKLTALYGAGIERLGAFRPAMLSMMHSVMLYQKVDSTINLMTFEPIDIYFQKHAKEKGKSVMALETAEDQIYALFQSQSLKRQAELLVCGFNNEEYALEQLKLLERYYKEADFINMYEMAFGNKDTDPCPSTRDEEETLNKNRNDKWMKKIPAIIKEKPSFIVVGCIHIIGEEGLLQQLRNMGYKVERAGN